MQLLENPKILFQKSPEIFDDLLVYLHVPKAAGNSSIGSIKSKIGIENFKSIQWNDIDNSWDNFIQSHINNPIKLVSGHFRMKHVLRLEEANVDYNLVTFIRHPIQRIISQYRYLCTDKDPNHIAFRKKYPSFDLYARKGVGANVISRILVQGALSFDDYLSKLKKRYRFIGVSEHYDFSMFLLMNDLGFDYTINQKKNVTTQNQFNQFEVSKSTYDYLECKHSLDIQLFQHFNEKYNEVSKLFIKEFIKERNTVHAVNE